MILNEFTHESVVDYAIKFHNRLNPLLWENNQLKPEISLALLKIAKDFIQFIDLPNLKLQDVTISGSNAAYTYTEYSDIDLHLIVEISSASKVFMKPFFDAKKNLYNFNHDITVKGIDIEVYVQDKKDTHYSAGVYSIINDEWISEPSRNKIDVNDIAVFEKVENYLSKIKRALSTNDLEPAIKVRDQINKLRKTGLERAGEFSVENLAFKVLRNRGFIDKLRQHIYDLEDRKLSLENLNEKT